MDCSPPEAALKETPNPTSAVFPDWLRLGSKLEAMEEGRKRTEEPVIPKIETEVQ